MIHYKRSIVIAYNGEQCILTEVCYDVTIVLFEGTNHQQVVVFPELWIMAPNPAMKGIWGVPTIAHPGLSLLLDIREEVMIVRPDHVYSLEHRREYSMPLDCAVPRVRDCSDLSLLAIKQGV